MQNAENHEYVQAMEMLNNTLREMKGGLSEVDSLSLKGTKKKMAKRMHQIYDELNDFIEKYEESQQHEDLNHAFRQIEILKPAFVLNYNEILR
jgi:uncharacterized protein YukE